MPTKLNRAGNQQNYVPAGNGDASGEYGDNATGSNKNFTSKKQEPENPTRKLVLEKNGFDPENMSEKQKQETFVQLGGEDNWANKAYETNNKIINKKFEKDQKQIEDVKSLNVFFNKELNEIEEKLKEEEKWLGAVGTEPLLLKSVLKELGYLEKPMVVDKDLFENYKKNGANVLYRGVKNKIDPEKELRESDDVWIGRGAKLHGIYFSDLKSEAETYQKDGGIVEAIIHPNAKKIDINKLNEIDNEDRMDVITGYKTYFENNNKDKINKYYDAKGSRVRKAIKAALMGYDYVDMGNNNYVVLNRNALIMKGE